MLAVPAAAAAQQGATRAESPRPSTSLAGVRRTPQEARRDSIVRMARAQLGRRYIFGGTTPDGFDCSGFTRYLMRALGYSVPRTAASRLRCIAAKAAVLAPISTSVKMPRTRIRIFSSSWRE